MTLHRPPLCESASPLCLLICLPCRYDSFYYYTRTLEGQQYAVHCRRKLPPGAAAPPPSEADVMDTSQPGGCALPHCNGFLR